MAIAAVLAPAAGGAVYGFFEAQWPEGQLFGFVVRLAGSLVGGFVLLVFIWFITVPFGIITYGLCLVARALGPANRLTWAAGGTVLGLAFGRFMVAFAADLPLALTTASGGIIGLLSGLALWKVWHMEMSVDSQGERSVPPSADVLDRTGRSGPL